MLNRTWKAGGGGAGHDRPFGRAGASSTLVTEYSVTVDGVPHQLFRVAHDTFNTSNAALVREFQLSAPREVDVLLVGGGGGGGDIDTSNVDFRTGGGGAGEVHQLSLGVVEAGSSIVVTGNARHGTLGTGSGGGGGAADGIEAAAGTGASGVAWIRVRLEAPS